MAFPILSAETVEMVSKLRAAMQGEDDPVEIIGRAQELADALTPDFQEYSAHRFNDDGLPIIDVATCGHCGRSWDDALGSSLTPVPSARCPFEYEHEDEDEDEDDHQG